VGVVCTPGVHHGLSGVHADSDLSNGRHLISIRIPRRESHDAFGSP
jgi:hypothetical protein